MLMQEIILKKRNGQRLTTEEIEFFVNGYTADNIPDYQASALLMAVWFSRMIQGNSGGSVGAWCALPSPSQYWPGGKARQA